MNFLKNIKHIKDTDPKKVVPTIEVFVGKINKKTLINTKIKTHNVYISARVVKKLYDSRGKENAEEFDFIIQNVKYIVTNPDQIYKNKPLRRATHILVKKKHNHSYLCFIQLRKNKKQFNIITVIPISDDSYLDRFNLM